ncbi:IclR family transcriptional regulator [Desulfuromonas sp. TF]|uniref:IclR family transcriptional regulator n=1 Tax=Desulfuromonas sp. TF TaxID=1232410 RepID=UPI00041D3107|nr:IclR family transcriptional regulator [Desulfuromonas sp. TF]
MASYEKNSAYNILSVSHAIDLLEQFLGNMDELGLADLSRSLQLPQTRVSRLLSTLRSRNFIEQDPVTEKYRLGFKTFELSKAAIRQLSTLDISRSIMESLVRECNETACMSFLKDSCIVNLGVVESKHPLRVMPRIGSQLPAYCTAGGKSQIAFFEEETLRRYVLDCQFQQYTPYTITDRQQLETHLRKIAHKGYAVQLDELEIGLRSVGAPIRDNTSRIVGAITLLGPSLRFSDGRIASELVPLVTRGAADISARLGYLQAS